YTGTTSHYFIAPLPFDARGDGVYIAADQQYNPFGTAFGVGPDGTVYPNLKTRWTTLGQRIGNYSTSTNQGATGLKGTIGNTSWDWDVGINYGHISQFKHDTGYVDYTDLAQALGPASGCTGACIPYNIFDQANESGNPQQRAIIEKYAAAPYY